MEKIVEEKNNQNHTDYLQKLKELRTQLLESQRNAPNVPGSNQGYGKTKRIGSNPAAGGIIYGEHNERKTEKGFAGILMLSFLTLLFETLFLLFGFYLFQ